MYVRLWGRGGDIEDICGCVEMVIWSERSDRLGRVSRGTSVAGRQSYSRSVARSVNFRLYCVMGYVCLRVYRGYYGMFGDRFRRVWWWCAAM